MDENVRDLAILFGAGASFGAGGILPERPPLGSQLYEQLATDYPGTWGALPGEVTEGFHGGNFEHGMRLIHDRFGTAIPQLMQEMAIYFIQFRPAFGSSLYCKLISDLSNAGMLQRTLFSTLNYDCVLEYSLLDQGLGVDYFSDGDNSSIPVWKLHGSSNFFSHQVQAGKGVLYGTGIVWQGGIQAFLDPNRVIEHCLVETGLAPIMSLYMEGKPLAVSPNSIASLQQKWRHAVMNSSAVFVVGARPWPVDAHIWDCLAETDAHVFFIGNKTEFSTWQRKHRTGQSTFLGSRFNTGYTTFIKEVRSQ